MTAAPNEQQVGDCRPYRARLSPEVCRRNRGLGREYCEKCPGLQNLEWIAVNKSAAPPPFHEALRSAMAAKGWIGAMLVEKSGLPSSSLYFILSGKKLPTLGNVQVLDQVLGTNLAAEYKEMLEKARPPVILPKRAPGAPPPSLGGAVAPRKGPASGGSTGGRGWAAVPRKERKPLIPPRPEADPAADEAQEAQEAHVEAQEAHVLPPEPPPEWTGWRTGPAHLPEAEPVVEPLAMEAVPEPAASPAADPPPAISPEAMDRALAMFGRILAEALREVAADFEKRLKGAAG